MPSDFAASVEEVFEGRAFYVPDYQRGYSWDKSNWQDLLDDIDLLEPGKDHYTGTIVLHRRGETGMDRGGIKYAAVDIVDGQQRLTTVVLLLHSIRAALDELSANKELAAGIKARYLVAEALNGEPLYRLQLGTDSNHFWTEAILGDQTGLPAEIGAHERLSEAKQFFQSYLAGENTKRGELFSDYLVDLFDRVAHRLQLIPYEVDDEAEVGVIFEVMNDRGKLLTELEKVKNYLLYIATKLSQADGLARLVNDSWSTLLRRLMQASLSGSADEDQLLRAHWLMAYSPSPRDWTGTATVKARFGLKAHRDRHDVLLRDLRKYVSGLEASSIAYCDIMVPSRPDSFSVGGHAERLRQEIIEAVERLRRLRVVAPFLPLLIAARVTHSTDGRGFIDLVQACERYAFRVYGMLEARADKGSVQLCQAAYELYKGTTTIREAISAVDALTRAHCSDVAFLGQLLSERNWYAWKALRYFLYEYEYEVAANRTIEVSWERLVRRDLERTIEHILPQTATRPEWTNVFDEDARARWTNDFGNLCLTEDNSAYGNKPFDRKRGEPGLIDPSTNRPVRCYANASLYQERELATYTEWTPSTVAARHQVILSWSLRRWEVPEGPSAEEQPADDTD